VPGGAVDPGRPAKGLDPVGEADQAGGSAGHGTADAVVTDRQAQEAVARLGLDLGHEAWACLAALARASATT
jgi:hypothetical protein